MSYLEHVVGKVCVLTNRNQQGAYRIDIDNRTLNVGGGGLVRELQAWARHVHANVATSFGATWDLMAESQILACSWSTEAIPLVDLVRFAALAQAFRRQQKKKNWQPQSMVARALADLTQALASFLTNILNIYMWEDYIPDRDAFNLQIPSRKLKRECLDCCLPLTLTMFFCLTGDSTKTS